MTTNEALRKIAIGLSRESVKVQAENLTELCETAREIAVEALQDESAPVLLAACRDALELLTNPDAEAFDADAVIETLERAIAQAERGEGWN